MARVWLHVGMQKTGTSALQDWLAASEDDLLAQGLLYLRLGKGQPASGGLIRALVHDSTTAKRIISGLCIAPEAGGPRNRGRADHPARPLIEAFDGHRIGVVIWLRRLDLFAEALVKQWVRWNDSQARNTAGFLSHHVQPLMGYDRLLRDWADTYPSAIVIPGIYTEESKGAPRPDSIRALLTAIGQRDLTPPDAAGLRANVSHRADLVRHYATLVQAETVRRTNRELMRRHGTRFAGRGDLIPPAQRARIRADCLHRTSGCAHDSFPTVSVCSMRPNLWRRPRHWVPRRSRPSANCLGGVDRSLPRRDQGGKADTQRGAHDMSDGRNGNLKQIICIKWGTKFGPEYVNRLHAMIARNITPPFRLFCFTDNGAGLHPDIAVRPLPAFTYDEPQRTRGKWPKSRLWADLGDVTGVVLFLDLDVIVTGDLDPFFTFGDPDDTVLGRNPNTPLERMGQTSVYRMRVGKLAPLQQIFAADPQGVADKYRYEQRFVTRNAPGGVKFWPRGWLAHFRFHCVPIFPLNYIREARIPRGTRIVMFPGSLNPPDAIVGRWDEADKARPPLEHLRAAFTGDRREGFVKHLRHYVRPTSWVAQLWRE